MRKSRLSVILAALAVANAGWAAPPAASQLPSGGQVTSGSATLVQNGSKLTITQSTDKGIINWQTFSIGSAAQVVFVQPGSQSATLNRVVNAEPSAIYGQLSANGQVFLINPNGIVVGPSGQINVNGLTLSTSDIADADFLSGSNSFSPVAGGPIAIEGSVTTGIGGLSLFAPEVSILETAAIDTGTGAVFFNSPEIIVGGNISIADMNSSTIGGPRITVASHPDVKYTTSVFPIGLTGGVTTAPVMPTASGLPLSVQKIPNVSVAVSQTFNPLAAAVTARPKDIDRVADGVVAVGFNLVSVQID